ncbi:MAG: M56 family metallopeptidase [Candidatus Aminicenantales bacterium]
MPGAGAGLPGLMAGYLLKTTAVLIVALLAAAAAKRRPAAFRHFILSSALISLVLLPLLTLAPVGWRSPLLPAWMAIAAPHPAEAPRAEGPGRASEAGRSVWLQVRSQGDGARSAAGRPGEWVSVSPASPAVERPALEESPAPLPNASPIEPQGRPGLPALPGLLLAVLWLAGLAVLLLRLAFGLAGASRLTTEGTPLDDASWRVLLERFIAFVSLRREVRLKSHPEVVVPLTWGFRRPIVLFPDGAGAWTDDERSSALYHELSHIKRADFLAMLLVRTSLALFWWNPLCWIVYREILKEQEIACDELVLRAGIRPSTYAASLLAFRRSAGFRWSPSAALLGIVGRSSFEGRLAAILKQKLTVMEVKMKTKIMLALALVAAVALIGTAGPAAGVEKSAVKTTVVETALPAPASLDVPAPDITQTTAEAAVLADQEQEKAKEAEKAKQAEKAKEAEKAAKEKAEVAKSIVIKSGAVEGKPIEVVITEGDQVRKLVLERPLTITKGKDGDTLVLTIDGKEIEVLKGEPLRLEIKGGRLEMIKEGRALKIGEGEGKTVYIVTPGGKLVTEGRTLRIAKEVETGKEGEPAITWNFKEKGKGEGVWVAKELPGEPSTMTWVGKGGRALALSPALDEKMLESVHAMQEQLEAIKAKKLDLSALEESLKKLESELQAKEMKLKALELKFDKVPGDLTVIKKMTADEAEDKVSLYFMDKDKTIQTAKAEVFAGSDDKNKGTIVLAFTSQDGEAGKAAFERALAKLKQDLPEGYKLVEQKYDADNGSMTFRIASPEGKKTDGELVKKLVEGVREAIKTEK